jgi:flagellar protein FliL
MTMADNTEKTPAAEGAAPAPAASGGFKSWLPLILTIAVMPGIAYAMTTFVLLPKLQKSLGITASARPDHESGGEHGEKKSSNAPRENVVMNKLLVNVSGTMGARYLLVSLSIAGTGSGFKEKMESRDAQLRDMACSALATKTLADLEKPGARNLIRSELISGFNTILGDSLVQEIYLTEFAIQ